MYIDDFKPTHKSVTCISSIEKNNNIQFVMFKNIVYVTKYILYTRIYTFR